MNNKSVSKCNSVKFPPAALVSLELQKKPFLLYQDVNIIGRNENAFICLKDQLISRKHCVISKTEDDEFTICDTSLSGTYVNDKRLVKNRIQTLFHKDKISLGALDKHVYVFLLNKTVDLSADQNEQLSERNSQMREKMYNLDNSHSMELKKLNQQLSIIESQKSELKEEMNSKLEAQHTLFKKEQKRLSKLVTYTCEQQEKAENKLKQMEQSFEMEKKKLMEEVESKIIDMNNKELELQQIKFDMEIQHQKDRNELEEKFQAELMDLKLKLEISEMEHHRLQEETIEAKQQLAESKQLIIDCEIEQTRLANEKVEVETKLASTIVDLTNEKDNVVRDLKRKLKEQEKEQDRVRKEIEGLEEHLMCSICTELFIEPTVLNCGHMFCKTCINEWKTKKKICPMCRAKITNCVQVFNLDSIIDKNVAMMSIEAKEHRDSVIKKRKNSPKSAKKKKAKTNTLRSAFVPVARFEFQPGRFSPPMVQMPNHVNFGRETETRRLNHEDIFSVDPFGWRSHAERAHSPPPPRGFPGWLPIIPMEMEDPMAAIDLTNVVDTPVQQTLNATATSTSTDGLIDLTVTP